MLINSGLRAGKVLAACFALSTANYPYAGISEAKKWIKEEFQPSTLTYEQQLKEMEWFIKAAKPFKGMELSQACRSSV